MAIARCENCGKPTQHRKPPGYSGTPHQPLGYQETAVVCGKPDCRHPALIWLKQDEETEYEAGERVFSIRTHSAKIRVQ